MSKKDLMDRESVVAVLNDAAENCLGHQDGYARHVVRAAAIQLRDTIESLPADPVAEAERRLGRATLAEWDAVDAVDLVFEREGYDATTSFPLDAGLQRARRETREAIAALRAARKEA